MPIPSQLNVDIINPETGTTVVVSGVTIDDSNQAIKIGFQAGISLGMGSTAVGRYALNASTGQGNTGIGLQAARLQTTGFGNTSVGAYSMNNLITGSSNTALGYYALLNATTSDNSTGVGAQSLVNLTNGIQNTALGQDSGRNITTGNNNICIGFNAQATSATVSNEITLGNAVNSILRCAVTSITSLSDARDKKNIEESKYGLDLIESLKPVTFEWETRDGAKKDIKDLGFIAQDLKKIDDDYLGLVYDENPEKLEASYGRLIPVLVKAIQELSKEVKQLKK